jgi:hypothetical protein
MYPFVKSPIIAERDRKQSARLAKLVLGGVKLEFGCAQVAVGDTLGNVGGLQRLCRRGAARSISARVRASSLSACSACARARSTRAVARSSEASAAPRRSSASRRLRGSKRPSCHGRLRAFSCSGIHPGWSNEEHAIAPAHSRSPLSLADSRCGKWPLLVSLQRSRSMVMNSLNLRRISIALTVVASILPGHVTSADAQSRFDGAWSVLIITDAGDCDRAYRYGVQIVRGRVQGRRS